MSLLRDPPIDPEVAWALAVLGRALHVACGFESDCRSLVFVLKMREPQATGMSDEDLFRAMTKAVLGQLVDLNSLIAKHARLKDDFADALHDAREARNYVAHDAVGELEQLLKSPGGLDRWCAVIDGKLHAIAYGKVIVAVLLSRNSAEPTPTVAEIDAYPPKIKSWVFRRDGPSVGAPIRDEA